MKVKAQAPERSHAASRSRFSLRPVALAVSFACCGGAAANPVGPNVTAGSATFNAAGKTLNVTNAPGTIINWNSFSIGSGEHTRFLQQSASSAVLNRVVGNDASSILGALSSNGRVFVVNPHGIVFGAGARIDTAGFIARQRSPVARSMSRT
jgi:filamentous hemagglutinin family protein